MYAHYRKSGEKQDRLRDHPWITAANIFIYFFHTFLCITNTYKHLSYLWLYCVCVCILTQFYILLFSHSLLSISHALNLLHKHNVKGCIISYSVDLLNLLTHSSTAGYLSCFIYF